MSSLSQLLDMLLPSKCSICSRPPSVLCASCLKSFEGARRAVHRGGLSGYSLFAFDKNSAKLISDFKEKGQFAIANALIDALLDSSLKTALLDVQAEALVAVPSSSQSFAKRGFVPAVAIANQIARHLNLPVFSRALWLTRSASDQAGLDQEARSLNLVAAMAGSVALSGRRVLLVDDIVTTGASLAEATRAVKAVGGQVVGFVTLAETILKIAPRTSKKV